jgi:uncharacterized protein YjbJ (UPF0337 family)
MAVIEIGRAHSFCQLRVDSLELGQGEAMQEDENNAEIEENHGLKDKITGLGQKIIGEVEMIGGILTGDPITAAEGEFNVEVGELREETEEDLKESEDLTRRDAETPREDNQK